MTVRLGVCGLGRAFSLMLPTLTRDERFKLVAAATPGREGRNAFERDLGGRSYKDMAALCADEAVDAIYIASPHQYHREHVMLAAESSKHCLLDKPLAISMAEGEEIVEAVERSGISLVVGPCHSFDAPIAHARKLIESERYGAVKQIQAFNYTDFLYRPRRPEELDTRQGGGVVFSQAIHQIDVVRLLAGGLVESVYAVTGNWDTTRSTEGAYSAILRFRGGAFANLHYNGYGRFDSDEMMHGLNELGFPTAGKSYGEAQKRLRGLSPADETVLKRTRNLGFADTRSLTDRQPDSHEHFGPVIVSLEGADLRLYPDGVEVFDDAGRRVEAIEPPDIPRVEVMDELYSAITTGRPATHSARWGLASLEVALGILESAASGQAVAMKRQINLSPV